MTETPAHIETKLVHAGTPEPRIKGAVVPPIFHSSTYEYGGTSHFDEVRYIRYGNTPNHEVLRRKLAAVEEAEDALVTASGMAAISTALLTVLESGDHLLVQEGLYGGTHTFITDELARLGIEADFIESNSPTDWKAKLRPKTRAIYVEAITNPLMRVTDLEAVADFAQGEGLVSVIDNTFATPVNFRPARHGFDLSLHSGTKYLGGHSDLMAGAVTGRADLVKEAATRLKNFGGALEPSTCALLDRGVKTLALRVRQQNKNALYLARYLADHPLIRRVNYPGLPDHPNHERARELFDGFGGMLSFELSRETAASQRLLKKFRLLTAAPSLGGVETLVTRPASTSHASLSGEERRRLGIADTLVRVSAGIEAQEDLIRDFDQALEEVSR